MKIPTARDIETPTQRTVKWRGKPPRPSSVFDQLASAPTSQRGLVRLPPLPLASLVVADDIVAPLPRRAQQGAGKYDAIFDRLHRDGMSATQIPAAYFEPLKAAARKYLARRPEVARASALKVLRVDDGTCGVWRMRREADK